MKDELLVKYLLGEATSDEVVTIEAWATASPDHRRYLDELEKSWQKSQALKKQFTVDEDASWERFRARIHQPPARIKQRAPIFRVAAAVLILLATGTLLYFLIGNSSRNPGSVYVVAQQNPLHDTLPDGSMVTLNKAATLVYPEQFAGNTRKVKLSGEAFFNVQPDREHPFIIQANTLQVEVVGTSFNVKQGADSSEVVVETGKVQLRWFDQQLLLEAGERAVAVVATRSIHKYNNTDQLYNYYRSKEFVCDNTPLWKLVDVLNEAYDSHIIIGNESIRNLPLTASFHNESLEQVLQVIRLTFNIQAEQRGNEIILR